MESVNVWSAQISSLPGVIPIPLDPSYLRSEPNNRLSVLSSDGKQIYTILNRVAKEILDLCDGTCDLPKILRLFQEKYPDQPRETLAHDLAQTLHSLTVNCLIVWKKEGRYMNDPFGSDYLTSVDPDELLILADASRFAEIEEAAAKSLSAKQSKNAIGSISLSSTLSPNWRTFWFFAKGSFPLPMIIFYSRASPEKLMD